MIIKRDPRGQLIHQINSIYMCGEEIETIDDVYHVALERLEFCFKHVKNISIIVIMVKLFLIHFMWPNGQCSCI